MAVNAAGLNPHSREYLSSAGVPQGTSLSPTFFNIFTGNIPLPIFNNSLTLCYADDITLLTSSNITQRVINKTNRGLSNIIS